MVITFRIVYYFSMEWSYRSCLNSVLVPAPPVGYQKVTKDELSDSEEEVYVKEEEGREREEQKAAKELEKGVQYKEGERQYEREKGLLVVYVLQGFTFAGVVSALLFYYD